MTQPQITFSANTSYTIYTAAPSLTLSLIPEGDSHHFPCLFFVLVGLIGHKHEINLWGSIDGQRTKTIVVGGVNIGERLICSKWKIGLLLRAVESDSERIGLIRVSKRQIVFFCVRHVLSAKLSILSIVSKVNMNCADRFYWCVMRHLCAESKFVLYLSVFTRKINKFIHVSNFKWKEHFPVIFNAT